MVSDVVVQVTEVTHLFVDAIADALVLLQLLLLLQLGGMSLLLGLL